MAVRPAVHPSDRVLTRRQAREAMRRLAAHLGAVVDEADIILILAEVEVEAILGTTRRLHSSA